MKHKFCILILILLQAGCAVELKDKPKDPVKVEAQATAQPDYVIDGPVKLTAHTKIEVDRLVLSENAVITTEDKNLTIIAKELVSDGGEIRNFSPGATAYWAQTGRNGSMIFIRIGKARGTLNVALSGEKGGHGKNGFLGPAGHPGCPTNGANGGNAGSLNIEVADNDSFNVNWTNEVGGAGDPGVKGAANDSTPVDQVGPGICARDRPDALPGKPGFTKGQVCMKLGSQESFHCQE